jgi:hypothetical protein
VELNAWATSHLPVAYAVEGPAGIQSNLLVLTGAGTVTLTITQPGNEAFNAAEPVVNTFCVVPVPVITVDATEGIVLNSNYETGNQWYKDETLMDGETNQTFAPEVTGSYQVEVTVDGCTGLSEAKEVVVLGLGREGDRPFVLYPNPARSVITIEDKATDFRQFEFEVIDVDGRMINNMDLNIKKYQGHADLHIEKLSAGSYILLLSGQRSYWQYMFQKR